MIKIGDIFLWKDELPPLRGVVNFIHGDTFSIKWENDRVINYDLDSFQNIPYLYNITIQEKRNNRLESILETE